MAPTVLVSDLPQDFAKTDPLERRGNYSATIYEQYEVGTLAVDGWPGYSE